MQNIIKWSKKLNINRMFFIVLFSLIFLSVFFTWLRYIYLHDFDYFITEDSVPNEFNLNSYK